MARPSRIVVACATLLLVVAPAYAANDQAPGQLKKEDVTGQTPSPAPAPVTTSTPARSPATKKTVSVNQGTLKNVVPKKTSQTAGTSGSAAPAHTTARPAPRQRASRRTARPRAAASSPRARVSRRSGSHARSGSARSVPSAAEPASSPARVAAPHHRAQPYARAGRPQPTTTDSVKVATETSAPLASISRAADDVVEVIPGTVILALAGLTALVLVLVARSYTMERRRARALVNSYGVTVEALATAIEAKDHCTGGHIERVRNLGLLLAAQIVPRETKDPQMAYGFLLHDIGKLAVPDAILRAPGRLSAEQWALMRRHPEEGVRMLSDVPFLDKALDVVRHHHERWDGGGYPEGLRGTEIPLWARIFSVVDALDAITAARPYRAGRAYQEALDEIRSHAGSQFDPDVVSALERIDPAEIEPLLEPTQIVDSPLAPVRDLRELLPA